MDANRTYDEIIAWYKEISLIAGIEQHLHWDHQVNLPPKGVPQRAEQLAFLDGLRHRRMTEAGMVAKVRELASSPDGLNEDARVNVREILREVDRATKVPVELVEAMARHDSQAQSVWVQARQNNDFAMFAPFLEKTIALRRQEAVALGFADSPYDAMIDYHEPSATEEKIRGLMEDLKTRLVPFLDRILGAPRYDAPKMRGGDYAVEAQRKFGRMVIGRIGYDFAGGRQDVAAHPFCSGRKGDVRITARFFEHDPRPSLTGMLHEAGHALYEQGLPDDHLNTPLGEAVSLGVHESQSRFWENHVGRSLAFWKHFYPAFHQVFPEQLGDIPLDEFHRMMNVVAPSLIRVDADEVTYNLHVILRFEIEVDLVAGRVAVADLPELWNAKLRQYLQLSAPPDSEGVLQDVHWSLGSLGYFPTYTIGNLYAAQLWAKLRDDLGGAERLIERGEFAPILDWMRRHIHAHGRRFPADELIERATGKTPSAQPLMDYLHEKYAPLYNL